MKYVVPKLRDYQKLKVYFESVEKPGYFFFEAYADKRAIVTTLTSQIAHYYLDGDVLLHLWNLKCSEVKYSSEHDTVFYRVSTPHFLKGRSLPQELFLGSRGEFTAHEIELAKRFPDHYEVVEIAPPVEDVVHRGRVTKVEKQ